ncbi:hypothetical protein Cgig2_024144 [Carnegiea gigantea]|uniref:Uncharacterized protein n=1 Tax=Carnegiea gigantea TaxID=171969 RepID=A0A9Q1QEV4_9CARY|nr:hypothetical protein Cgig2_024144 [Carnegiea gigantea]
MTTDVLPASGWGLAARRCDTCRAAAALIYCRADAAFLCGACDAKLHDPNPNPNPNRIRPHERVWVCEVCEQAPAVVTCKADAAALCTACDRDIHAANPLASRHERVPVVPFLYSATDAAVRPSAFLSANEVAAVPPAPVKEAEDDADAWLIPNPSTKVLMADFLCNDSDLLDFGYDSQNLDKFGGNERFEGQKNFAFTDSVVPTQSKGTLNFSAAVNGTFENSFDIDFSQPNKHQKHNHQLFPAFNYTAQASASSSDIGVVPDGNATSMSEVSYTFTKSMSSAGAGDGGPSTTNGAPAPAMDREARVLRYREKRKNRKFEKTIRYASRKAYAETRPRIKGRFAKRSETAGSSELDQIFGFGSGSGSPGFALDNTSGFGVVPFFD